MDQTRAGTFPQPLSARQSGRLLARALAKCRSILQQLACEFLGRIAQRLPRRRGAPRLAWGFDAASAAQEVICHSERSRGISHCFPELTARDVSTSLDMTKVRPPPKK